MARNLTLSVAVGLLTSLAWTAAYAGEEADGPPADAKTSAAQVVRRAINTYMANQAKPSDEKPAEMIKATYLGIATAPTEATLQSQLGLPDGVGLIVQYVDPQSPAQAATVEPHDVLWKLNDQILVNGEQLGVLVRTFKPGDEITLTLFRQGKPRTATVALGEKEVPKLADGSAGRVAIPELRPLRAMPGKSRSVMTITDKDIEIRLLETDGDRRVVARNTKEGKVLFDGPINTPEQCAAMPAEIRQMVENITVISRSLEGDAEDEVLQAELTLFGKSNTVTVKAQDAGLHLLAKDKSGKALFDGPVNTAEQRAAVPAEVMETLRNQVCRIGPDGERAPGGDVFEMLQALLVPTKSDK